MITTGLLNQIRNNIQLLGLMALLGIAGFVSMRLAAVGGERFFGNWGTRQWIELFLSVVTSAIVWFGNLKLASQLDKIASWEKRPTSRLILSIVLSTVYTIIAVTFLWKLYGFFFDHRQHLGENQAIGLRQMTVMGVTATLLMNAIYVGIYFFRQWQRSYTEAERLKQENLRSQLETLKSQINPHFLFNSLNTLSVLIEENPKTATEFVEELAKVYRYILQTRDREVISLAEELRFIDAFVFMLKVRFGGNIRYKTFVPSHAYSLGIPPLTLQMLVENAIKHNIVSSQKPLTIEITLSDTGMLSVRNNLQRKAVTS
jgi:two-component system, LytTR family, sensor kinase